MFFVIPKKGIRKLAACLICELVWNNEVGKARLCEICEDSTPVGGAVSINIRIPQRLLVNNALIQIFEGLSNPKTVSKLSHDSGKFWSFPKYTNSS